MWCQADIEASGSGARLTWTLVPQLISLSSEPERIVRVLGGETCGTVFHARSDAVKGRKRWILTGACMLARTHVGGWLRTAGACVGTCGRVGGHIWATHPATHSPTQQPTHPPRQASPLHSISHPPSNPPTQPVKPAPCTAYPTRPALPTTPRSFGHMPACHASFTDMCTSQHVCALPPRY